MLIDILNKFLIIFILVVPNLYLLIIFFRFKKRFREDFFLIIFLFLLSVIFLNKLLFKGQTLSAQDFNNIQIPFFHFFRESILTYKEPPIWNSRFGGGFDAFSNPISAYFSPFNFVFLIFKDVYTASSIFILLQLFLISTFSFIFFRELRFNKAVSFFGAVVFTFNGFVTMRLSPGVGIEYLYSYKWIPLIMVFTFLYFKNYRTFDLVLLSLSFALSFEGNLNIVISMWFFWFLLIVFVYGKDAVKNIKKLIFVPVLSFFIFAIKILPFLYLMKTSTGRISESVGKGWRINDKIKMGEFWSYFPPFRHLFGAAVFTPGLIASIFFFLCLIVLLVRVFTKKKIDKIFIFFLLSIFMGFILVTYNPLSDFLFKLPLFNRLTIVPAFMVLIFVPAYIMSVYGLDMSVKFLMKKINIKNKSFVDLFGKFIVLGISCLVFLEILIGPSTFGNNTYSFNFAKMDRDEVYAIPPYNVLKDLKPGVFLFYDNSDTFLYPYAVSILDLYTLNTFKYFYSPVEDKELLKKASLFDIEGRTDYILSTQKLEDRNLILLKEVSTSGLIDDFDSYSILDKRYNYLNLQSDLSWEEKLYIYSSTDNTAEKYWKRTDNNPVMASFVRENEKDGVSKKVYSSIKYSPWWKIAGKNEIKIGKDDFGYLWLDGVNPGEKVEIFYFNPFIYLGMLLSIIGLLCVLIMGVRERKFHKIK